MELDAGNPEMFCSPVFQGPRGKPGDRTIDGIDAGGMDPQHDLVIDRLGDRQILDLQDLGSAEAMNALGTAINPHKLLSGQNHVQAA